MLDIKVEHLNWTQLTFYFMCLLAHDTRIIKQDGFTDLHLNFRQA